MKRERTILWVGIGLSAALMAAFSIWKYQTFQMNGLDLAIFNQIFWNTVHGQPFQLSIYNQLSLGDHAEFFILALAPLYSILPRPETLLVLQAIALALSGWPAYRIAKRFFSSPSPHSENAPGFSPPLSSKVECYASDAVRAVRGSARSPSTITEGAPSAVPAERGSEFTNKERAWRSTFFFPLILALSLSFSPFLQNASLYEFHVLIFALPLLLFAAEAYLSNSFKRYILLLLLALTVREDVALVAAAFGIIAALDRRGWKWIAIPIGISSAWFLGAMKLISHFSISGSYKFTAYYSWILDGITLNELANHFLTIPMLEFFLGIFMPFLFLPLLRPKWLLLSALPAAQHLLTSQGAGALTFQTHYVILLLPGLLLATIEALRKLSKKPIITFEPIGLKVIMLTFVIATIYSILTLGPLPAAAWMIANGEPSAKLVAAKRAIVSSIPPNASVLTSYDFLPALSSREHLYSLHYAFPGRGPFGTSDYTFPDPDHIIINQEDFLIFALNFPSLGWTRDHYESGDDRLHQLLSRGYGLVDARGPILHFKKGAPDTFSDCAGNDVCLSFSLPDYPSSTEEPFVEITLHDGSTTHRELRPLGFAFYPLTIPLILPDDFHPDSAEVRLVRPVGTFALSDIRSNVPVVTNLIPLGPAMAVPL